jgi:indolepyruvate ferredoxin oxidoreductase beta subunit
VGDGAAADVVLGFAARHIGFTADEWLQVLRDTVPPKTVAVNEAAFRRGYAE